MNPKPWILILAFGVITDMVSVAQPANDLFQAGLLKEKEFDTEGALALFEKVITADPKHSNALTHASRMLSNIAGRMPIKEVEKRKGLLDRARVYAQKSIKLSPANSEARMAYIISLGLLSEQASSGREKVENAQTIHEQATQILKSDTTFAEAYFVLGKWQLELSQLNWFELTACNVFFGGFPEEISLESSLTYFEQALRYKSNSILFLFGQASALHALDQDKKAIEILHRAIALPQAEPDDAARKERCKKLLLKISR